METLDIYTRVLTSLGIKVKKNGELHIDGSPIKINSKPLVVERDDTDFNNVVVFDPMDEDLTKSDKGLNKLLRIITLKSNNIAFELVRLLLTSDDNTNLPSYLHIILAEADMAVRDSGSKTKKPIQASTIKALDKLEAYCIEEDIQWFKPVLKNPVNDKGEKFLSGIVCDSPLPEAFEDTEHEIHGLFKRREDGIVLETLFKSLSIYFALDGVVAVANSNNTNLTAYMKFYMAYVKGIENLIKPIQVVAEELYSYIKPGLKYTVKHIEEVVSYDSVKPVREPANKTKNRHKNVEVDEWGDPIEDDRGSRDRYDHDRGRDYDRDRGRDRDHDRYDRDRGRDRDRDRGRGRDRDRYDRGRDRGPIYIDKAGGEYTEMDIEVDRDGYEFIYDEYERTKQYLEDGNRGRSRGRDDVPWDDKPRGFVSV